MRKFMGRALVASAMASLAVGCSVLAENASDEAEHVGASSAALLNGTDGGGASSTTTAIFLDGYSRVCSGTLLTPKWVLTSATCVPSDGENDAWVQADANKSDLGVSGMLRPTGARRQALNVRVSDLPTALNAVPQGFWPYGRVVAVEEAHEVPVSARPEVRRNMEKVIKTLNDLGVVVYEWSDSGRS